MGDLPPGTEVAVLGEGGRVLFYGTISSLSPPWVFWHRVTPEGDIDLPPLFRVVRRLPR